MSTNYFSEALMQQMLYLSNLKQMEKLTQEIEELKSAIFIRQKKHRRCDKQIQKVFNCPHCEKLYASDVALKLHVKLKHSSEKNHQQKSTSNNLQDHQISPTLL